MITKIINNVTHTKLGSGVTTLGGGIYGGTTIVVPGVITGGITTGGITTATYAGGSHVLAFGAHHCIAGFNTEFSQMILVVLCPGKYTTVVHAFCCMVSRRSSYVNAPFPGPIGC
jgi:hypothetical protein